MALDNNPLKQYFRRPAVYLKLPSEGKYYKQGVVNIPESGELPVYPMTAIDEITSKTPDALYNGTAIHDIIKSCVPNIIDPYLINNVDLDAILIAIKSATSGNEIEIESECPSCQKDATYGIDLLGVLRRLQSPNYDQPLEIGELKIKFKPIVYKNMNEASLGQFSVQKSFTEIEAITDEELKSKKSQEVLKNITLLTMNVLSKAIEYIETPGTMVDNVSFILDYLQNCDRETYVKIRDYNAELKAKTEIQPLDMVCIHCKHEYKQMFTLNATDFFA